MILRESGVYTERLASLSANPHTCRIAVLRGLLKPHLMVTHRVWFRQQKLYIVGCMSMRYTDAQELCAEVKEDYLLKATTKLVDNVLADGAVLVENNKLKRNLVSQYVIALTEVNQVLDDLSHKFWVNFEDK